jgi:hypothetical protein
MRKFSKWIVALVILLNVTFTGAVLYLCLKSSIVPDSLIVAWFGFTTGELWLLAGIRKAKMQGSDE